MNNPIFIAYDNEDSSLGHFFESCHDKIREVSVKNGLNFESLPSPYLSKEQINQRTSQADEYIFSAFSHGTDTALLCGKNLYISKDENVKNFYNSIFYTFACFTANGIGKEFSEVYVLGYLGYNDSAWVVPAYESIFVECATKGLISYIEGKTLKEARADMIAEYDKHLSKASVNPIYACLLKNKQALVILINEENKRIFD